MSPASPGFPCDLLVRPASERLAHFKRYTVAHPLQKAAHEALLRAIREPAGASLVVVVGPTGVGKTTLRLKIEQELIREALPALDADHGRIPVASVEAAAPDSGQYNWRDFYLRGLAALDEPLVGHKVDLDDPASRRAVTARTKVVTADLRRAFEQALRQRRPAAFLIDEAQHLAKMRSGRRLQDQMDCIKSLASLTGTAHVLLGTYELLVCRNLSAQLTRRSIDIHFPRYQPHDPEDILAFKRVLVSFQRQMPLAEEPDLAARWAYCYERSVGCVGVLKDWLTRALDAALREGASTLTPRHLDRHALTLAQCAALAKETHDGEAELREPADAAARVRGLLGLGVGLADGGADAPPRPGHRRPGERAPQRDPVGAPGLGGMAS